MLVATLSTIPVQYEQTSAYLPIHCVDNNSIGWYYFHFKLPTNCVGNRELFYGSSEFEIIIQAVWRF